MLLRLVNCFKFSSKCTFSLYSCNFNTYVPKYPFIESLQYISSNTAPEIINLSTITLLERLSLVNFGNSKSVEILDASVKFADGLLTTDTNNVAPLVSVLEDRNLLLRSDEVKDFGCRKIVVANARFTEEEYFVAPPGNIPLESKDQEVFKSMGELLKKILDLTTKLGFFKFMEENHKNPIIFGPLATLLANNIHNEWFKSNVVSSDFNVFLYDSKGYKNWLTDCQNSYIHAVEMTDGQLPFGLVSVFSSENKSSENKCVENSVYGLVQCPTNVYRRLVFINEKDSQQYFYRLQRQRKIWWRKFSTDPERFTLTEDKYNKSELVQIRAILPWSAEVVETIVNHKNNPFSSHEKIFEVKCGRKRIVPHVIESLFFESPAVVTYLCDSFQQLKSRNMLRLHHSLAPYKAAVSFDPAEEKRDDLNKLVKFISLSLRRTGLHTLCISNKTQDLQFAVYDAVGIPYTVVVTADTLINGIVGLRSRDTTLQEQVHISRLTTYLQKLLGCSVHSSDT